ncbi:Hypothetical protein A7982_01325 [Minicystis rosea]|nr:Hypothetical protein A7982_01325 [Minicystis rosea]
MVVAVARVSPVHKETHMKSILMIIASMSVSLLAAACSVPTAPEAESEAADDTEQTAEADQAIGGSGIVRITTYYSDATKTREVGYCYFTTCGLYNECTGYPTSYVKVEQYTCTN